MPDRPRPTGDWVAYLGMPGYGQMTGDASRGFWRASRLPAGRLVNDCKFGSLLAANFNRLWCNAHNMRRKGVPVAYFAMQHSDIGPEDWWLDTLIEELEARQLDVLGVAAPIKDSKGVTSTALAHPDGDPFRVLCRLTTTEIAALPETFTSEDVGHPLLLNTGLWVCRFDADWTRNVHFTINDEIVELPNGDLIPQVEPEDWFFSRLLHEQGARVGCTRKVKLTHRGEINFHNDRAWGHPFDREYLKERAVPVPFVWPSDVAGWLSPVEGKALADAARGKRVLEVGSYCGLSTICLAQTAEHVTSVDTHDGRGTPHPRGTFTEFEANLRRFGVAGKVTPYVCKFKEFAAIVGGAAHDFTPPLALYDLVFIDGAHDRGSVESDIAHALPLLAPGGLLAFHDYGGHDHPAVKAAVDALAEAGAEVLSLTESLAVVRPPAALPLEV